MACIGYVQSPVYIFKTGQRAKEDEEDGKGPARRMFGDPGEEACEGVWIDARAFDVHTSLHV